MVYCMVEFGKLNLCYMCQNSIKLWKTDNLNYHTTCYAIGMEWMTIFYILWFESRSQPRAMVYFLFTARVPVSQIYVYSLIRHLCLLDHCYDWINLNDAWYFIVHEIYTMYDVFGKFGIIIVQICQQRWICTLFWKLFVKLTMQVFEKPIRWVL